VAGPCEHDIKPLGLRESSELVGQLSDFAFEESLCSVELVVVLVLST
jgi:hypothetical protein